MEEQPRVDGNEPGPETSLVVGLTADLVTERSGLVAHTLGKHFNRRPILRGVSLSVRR
ncbi:MAG: hypothetical protein FD153_857, partial [Rhodospirillaceae bacterium]